MFSHVMLGAADMDASKQFYDATMATLGYDAGFIDPKGRCFYRADSGIFALSTPIDGQPACGANGGTVGFAASSTDVADAWHAAGLANGGTTLEDPPGWRGEGPTRMYLAYLRDPAGNKICVLHR